MIRENENLHQLRMLILKSQSESLSEAEIGQLNELVQAEGGVQEAVATIDQLCAFTDSGAMDSLPIAEVLSGALGQKSLRGIPRRNAGGVGADTELVVPPPMSDVHLAARWNKGYGLLALAASHLLIASLAWTLAKPSPTDSSAAGRNLEATSPHAEANSLQLVSTSPQMISMTACVWRPSANSDPAIGESIRSGQVLDLVEGIAELRIGEGTAGEALVRIEGPASVFVLAGGQLGLRRGSLTAKSLGTGSGNVMVDTPIGQVSIDGQSSIGLVADASVSEVHLFSGQAVVKPVMAASTANELRLEAGEAVRFSSKSGGDYEVVVFEASMSSFVSARSSGFDPLNIGPEYVSAVLDSKPNVYWRFEELCGESPYYIENLGSSPNMDAAIIDDSGWRRYGENRVAELGKIGTASGFHSTGLWPPKPTNEYTIEMWVKPELFHHGEIICLHKSLPKKDGRYSHTVMIESLAQHWHNPLENLLPNRLRFVHRTPASGEVTEGSNLVAKHKYQVRTWQHLVAQKKSDRVSLWLDGRLSAEQADPSPLNKNMRIVLGQLYISRPERRFVGQIDEVAIYDRCLTPQEMRMHIRAAGRSVASENRND